MQENKETKDTASCVAQKLLSNERVQALIEFEAKFSAICSSYFAQNPIEVWIPKTLSACVTTTLEAIEAADSIDEIRDIVGDHCHETLSRVEFICGMHLLLFRTQHK